MNALYGILAKHPRLQEHPKTVSLVAECGVNWNNLSEAKTMIKSAWWSGATHAKFQAYGEDALKEGSRRIANHLKKVMLTKETAQELKGCAEDLGLTWFATPTSVERVDFLEDVGVSLYKIREKDSENIDLLKRVFLTKKPMFVSSQRLPGSLDLLYHPMIKWLYCVPKYPPALAEIRLSENIGVFDGYSNHYPDIAIPYAAACLGARVLEVHVTLDHGRPDLDAPVSIDFLELFRLSHMLCLLEQLPEARPIG